MANISNDIPDVDDSITIGQPLDISQLTTVALDGTGVFDKLMAAGKLHIQEEFEQDRIRGTDYAQTYLGLLQASQTNAIQFLTAWFKATLELEILKAQAELYKSQAQLYKQKIITEMAQTNDISTGMIKGGDDLDQFVPMIPTDGSVPKDFEGAVGAQIGVTREQASGYMRDGQQKVIKLMTDHINMLVSAGTAGATDQYLADIIRGIKESDEESYTGTEGVKANSLLGKVIAQARGLNPENRTTHNKNTTTPAQPWNPDNTDFDNDPNTAG